MKFLLLNACGCRPYVVSNLSTFLKVVVTTLQKRRNKTKTKNTPFSLFSIPSFLLPSPM